MSHSFGAFISSFTVLTPVKPLMFAQKSSGFGSVGGSVGGGVVGGAVGVVGIS